MLTCGAMPGPAEKELPRLTMRTMSNEVERVEARESCKVKW
jgi:hypothetical protein